LPILAFQGADVDRSGKYLKKSEFFLMCRGAAAMPGPADLPLQNGL
jgi:hypothetical protein